MICDNYGTIEIIYGRNYRRIEKKSTLTRGGEIAGNHERSYGDIRWWNRSLR
jgi:hypothetical protein